jgi:hypothetical protein
MSHLSPSCRSGRRHRRSTSQERADQPSDLQPRPAGGRRARPGHTKRLFKVYVNHLKLSTELAKRQIAAFILRRTKLTRYGTDHDPAWVTLDL